MAEAAGTPLVERRGRAGAAMPLLAPATLMVLIFLALPLLILMRYSFNRFIPGQFMVEALTPENYSKFFTDPYYFVVLRTTLAMSFAVTLACLVLAFPLAQLITRASARWKPALIILVIVPLFIGNAVRAAGWMVAFGQKGLVNTALGAIGIPPITLMYTPLAVFFGIISVNLPYVVLTLQSVLEGIDAHMAEASQSLGASRFETWRLVTLPLAMPGLIAAAVLSFILTMNAYATPLLLGGPQFQMMAPVVATTIISQNNWPFGASVAFILMTVTLCLTALMNLIVLRRYGASETARAKPA